MSIRTVVFLGNCQALALADVYGRYIAVAAGQRVTYVESYAQDAEGREAIAEADIVVEQKFDSPPLVTADALKAGARKLSFPSVVAGFYWPYGSRAHPRNAPRPCLRSGPYPAQMGDGYLNKLIAEGVSGEAALERYLEADLNKRFSLDRLFELSIDKQRRRDEGTGIATAAEIEARARSEHLFLTPDHPNLGLFKIVARQVYAMMGVESRTVDDALRRIKDAPFPLEALPIHPQIVEHYGLAFVTDDFRFRFLSEGGYTFQQFFPRYVDYTWNVDLQEGIWLSGCAEPSDALAALDRGLRLSPGSADGFRIKSHLLQRLGRREEALQAAEKAVALAPADPDALVTLAERHVSAGNLEAAEPQAERALAVFPFFAPAYRVLCEARGARHDLAGAVAAARAAVDCVPGDRDLQERLGRALALAGDLEGSIAALHAALSLQPASDALWAELADIFRRRQDYERAADAALKAIALATTNPHHHARLGHILLASGDLDRAEPAFARALELEPGTAAFRAALVDLKMRQGKIGDALALNAGILDEPDAGPADLARHGRLLGRNDDLVGGEWFIRAALERAPDTAQHWADLSELLQRRGEFEAAQSAAEKALDLEPRNPHFAARAGHVLHARGDVAGAEERFRSAAERDPGAAEFKLALMSTLCGRGKSEDALALAGELRRNLPAGAAADAMEQRIRDLLATLSGGAAISEAA